MSSDSTSDQSIDLLRESEARLRFLLELSDALKSLDDPVEIEGTACRLVAEALDVDRAYYVEIDEAAGVARVDRDYVRKDAPSLSGEHSIADFSWSVEILRGGNCHIVGDTQTSPIVPEKDRQASLVLGIMSSMAVPLLNDGALVGAFSVTSSQARDWSDHEIATLRDVSDRIWSAVQRARAESSLLKSESLHRTLVQSMDEAVCVFERLPLRADGLRDYRYVSMNPAMQRMFGIPDLSGQSIRDNFPDEVEAWYDDYDRVLKTGQPVRVERESEPQGMVLDMFITRIEDGTPGRLLAVIRDITARKRAEAAMRRSQARFAALVNATSYLIFSMSPDWSVMNELDGKDFIKDTPAPSKTWLDEYIDPADQDTVMEAIEEAIRTAGVFELEHRVKTPDGTLAWALSRAVPVRNDAGEIVEWFGAASDVTERRQALEALSHAQRLEAVGRLAGAIAHDFNNQLMVIVSNIELARISARDGAVARHLDAAFKAVDVAQSLVKRLVVWSGKSETQPKVLNLNDVVLEMSEILNGLLENRIRLRKDLARDLWPVNLDMADVDSAVLNLVLNARDAMPNGGEIRLETANLTLGGDTSVRSQQASAGEYVCLSITDTGTGMSEEVREQIFTPFFTTKEQGTGLGLFSVASMVRQVGGFVDLESEPGHGTTIRLHFPRAGGAQVFDGEQLLPPDSRPVPDASRVVLLVEDQDAVRRSTRRLLEALGYQVTEASDAVAALGQLNDREDICLVFSDISMPGQLSGRDLARRVREAWPGVAVLLTTGFSSDIDTRSLTDPETGVSILPKPYRLKALEQALGHAFEATTRADKA